MTADKPDPSGEPLVRRAVILAGGKGTRLRPFTFAFPKPLVPVGETPIIDIVMRQLQAASVRKVTLAVGHLAELLMAYFRTREYGDMEIDYSREESPLGTAGPLSLIDDLDERFFVLNGDLLTSLDLREFARRHAASGAVASIASYERSHQVDLGILEINKSGELTGYIEKPTYNYLVSMGIYILEPSVLNFLKKGEHCDLPELVRRLLSSGQQLHVYPFEGYWLDIGRPEDYARALEEFQEIRSLLFR